ncbi:transposon Ty3-I Gag-Pol polyprotein [Trichonephila inaurata madagascariensis]|uniref:Transposon Ty3-I Gag-Pol polyprotein n=1 Tax=Trichonephila inaurata madagascariensis TaxID=2747483 RepID=A0A8X7CNR5_9ARAC|nr:transposon Ty3-I Gag-Pol polyprotein [Trichonephila inaurata madagascariensis]
MCVCYLDDIIVFSETFDNHLQRLLSVLKCIQDTGLVLIPKKCVFGNRQIKIMGHLVSEEGIMPDPGKLKQFKTFQILRIYLTSEVS